MTEQQHPAPGAWSPPYGWGYGPWGPPPPGWSPPPGWTPPTPEAAAQAPTQAPAGTTPAAPARPPNAPASGWGPAPLADWSTRAYATLLDLSLWGGLLTLYSLMFSIYRPLLDTARFMGDLLGTPAVGTFISSLYWLITAAWWLWQWAERGRTGSSFGQRIMGVRVVDQETRKPVGPGRSILRSLTHAVDVLPAGLGYARPTWTRTRQTWADKIHGTVVVSTTDR